MTSVTLANDFHQKLLKTFKTGLMAEMQIDPAFEKIKGMAATAGATYVEKHAVPHPAEEGGKRVTGGAEVLFVRFGQGNDAAWVAFVVFHLGWAGAYRPFTENTATMPWLDAFVTKKLVG